MFSQLLGCAVLCGRLIQGLNTNWMFLYRPIELIWKWASLGLLVFLHHRLNSNHRQLLTTGSRRRMAQRIIRLRQWPPAFHHHHCHFLSPLNHLHLFLSSHTVLLPPETGCNRQRSASTVPLAHRNVHYRSRGLRFPNAPAPDELGPSDASSDSDDDPSRKSRNQKKREARRAVQWGMDLASFSTPQIRRILR